ncbi:hypothetical protein AB6A40_006304 [Gnathostoma spinigerum]|uniref:Fe2OG dioxygenase domain-containing protein n=1 Tax=Gnathostoma spinigerum TaxID=75299 RepID=A0ABD6EHZ5_9BILA
MIHLRNFAPNLIRGKSNFFTSIKLFTRNASSNVKQKMSDASSDESIGYDGDALTKKTLFRKKFKFYKKRSPPPDLSEVIDIRSGSNVTDLVSSPLSGVDTSFPPDLPAKLGFRPFSEWKISSFKSRPGLFILSDVIHPSSHLKWIERALLEYPEPPNTTNVHLHMPEARDLFPQYAKKLHWATLGLHYNWTTKEYPFEGYPLPRELCETASVVSQALRLGKMQADATIVNYYFPKSTLSPHIDRSERFIERPLISLSFGQSAVYLTGGTDLDDAVEALLLHSGDVLVMYGDQRLVYHAVARIEKTRTFDGDGTVAQNIVDYANSNRVNITIRQVDKTV